MALCEEDRRSSPLDGVLQPELCNNCLNAPTCQKSHLCCHWEQGCFQGQECCHHQSSNHPQDCTPLPHCLLAHQQQLLHSQFIVAPLVGPVLHDHCCCCCIFVACVWLLLFLCLNSIRNVLIKNVFLPSFGGYLDEALDRPAFKGFFNISMRQVAEEYDKLCFGTDWMHFPP